MAHSPRVLLAKPRPDSHDRGVRYVARRFRDAGFHVIFMNFLLASEVANTALDEDVQVIGVSSSSGGHMPLFEDLIACLQEHGMQDILLLGGGVIPEDDQETLKEWGVKAIFGPGTTADDAIALIRNHMNNLQGPSA